MLINGEKWACEACVRGHRVSTCQHSDRPLTHINKKGRPVSQCPHCRGLRKARAAHVACECGSKPHGKDDCGDAESKSDLSETHSDSHSDPGADPQQQQQLNQLPPQSHSCCCSHGMRCTCALKKEHLDPVSEVTAAAASYLPRRRATSASKPRLIKAGSDNALTVFTNGHHKPIHKHNDSAHKCGVPYKIPIPHSVNGNEDIARRSTDSLPLVKQRRDEQQPNPNLLPHDLRLVRSAHGSPDSRASSLMREYVGPLDLNSPPPPPVQFSSAAPTADEYLHSPRSHDIYYDAQDDQPIMSAGLAASNADWADLNLPLDHTAFSAAYTQPSTYATLGPPTSATTTRPRGLTSRSSSGDISDTASGYVSRGTPQTSPFRSNLASPPADPAAPPHLDRLNSASLISMPPVTLPTTTTAPLSVDTEFPPATASPTEFEEPNALHADVFERHGFTVHDAQKLAHPETPTKAMSGLSIPPADDFDHLFWNSHSDPLQNTFVSQDLVESISAGTVGQWR